jgi:hypothetical protein
MIVIFALALFASGSANAVGVGKTCTDIGSRRCNAGLFCDHKPGTCAVGIATGKCVRIPRVCPMQEGKKAAVIFPVCGCNGKTYGNNCERIQAKAQLNHNGQCK